MQIRRVFAIGLAAVTSAAFAQTFEVASIKASAPQQPGRLMIQLRGGPGTPDPGQITYTNVTVKLVMQNAYDVKGYQIQGPQWFDSERFDISAKIAPGTTKEQFKVMLQNLLSDRFHVKLHHDSKEMPIYALVVAKGGPKLTESVDDPPPTDGGPNAPPPGPAVAFGGSSGGVGGGRVTTKDGMPMIAKGGRGAMMTFGMNGRMKMSAGKQTMANLTDLLANQLGRPVQDQTGLTKTYDYTLEFVPDEGQRPMGGMMIGPKGDGGDGGGAAPDNAGPTIFTAVQEQLGLRLEARKGPVDLLIVDSADKTPTEN